MQSQQPFNIIILGTGGQGQITLLQILAKAAMTAGLDIKTSELHGLSQRGGSVEVHIKFGKEVHSPLIKQGGADLVIAQEIQEALKGCYFSSKEKTNFIINDLLIPIPGEKNIGKEYILQTIKNFSKETILIPAQDICQQKLGTSVTAGVFLIAFASYKKLIPLEPEIIKKALKQVLPQKYLKINLDTLNLVREEVDTNLP
ncbi:MAG: indolepyruvate oxidoreductase subunit beta [Candidatus Pacebacteria bacterium]|nr:indolepyruvate oxidoreductase subunit beta [Candidatus Paceibacterota bacterium]